MPNSTDSPRYRWASFLFGILVPLVEAYGLLLCLRWLDFYFWLPPFVLFVPCLIGLIAYFWRSPHLDFYTGRFIVGAIVGYVLAYWWFFAMLFWPADFHD